MIKIIKKILQQLKNRFYLSTLTTIPTYYPQRYPLRDMVRRTVRREKIKKIFK